MLVREILRCAQDDYVGCLRAAQPTRRARGRLVNGCHFIAERDRRFGSCWKIQRAESLRGFRYYVAREE